MNARGARDRHRHRSFHAAGTRVAFAVLTGIICFTLCSCGPRRVRADFTNYEKSYAVTSNREVLLNLARLEQRDPTYFFKLGQISSQYRMQASLTATGSYVPNTTATGQLPGGTGGPGLIYENDPQFQFIPVNDDTNARLLLNPVPAEVFYDLYYQGWRVDQLFRLMVDRIEVTLPTAHGCKVEIIRNVPPPVFKGADGKLGIDYDHEQASIAGYVTFLRVSAVVYALQKYGMLQLRGTTSFEPLDQDSWLPADSAAPPANASAPASSGGPGKPSGMGPTASDFDQTAAKGQFWQQMKRIDSDGKTINVWVLGQMAHHTMFQLTSSSAAGSAPAEATYGDNVADIEQQLRGTQGVFSQDESLQGMSLAPELTDILEILYSGFSIEGPSDEQETDSGFCPADWSKGPPSRLVMRSLIGLMAAAAQEQASFDQLKADAEEDEKKSMASRKIEEAVPGSLISLADDKPLKEMTNEIHSGLLGLMEKNNNGKAPAENATDNVLSQHRPEQIAFTQLVPPIEQLPVLRMDWSTGQPATPLATAASLKGAGLAVNYGEREYVITDPNLASNGLTVCTAGGQTPSCYAKENQYWNRDMFRLIGELSSQVTVDISKFPLPAILQLHTD